jgi:hypothetical protein
LPSPAAAAAAGVGSPRASQQQQQQQQTGLLGLSLFQGRGSPLAPLSKRRRQTQQRADPSEAAAAAGAGGDDDAAAAAAAERAAAAAADAAGSDDAAGGGRDQRQQLQLPQQLCSCAARLPLHFGQLQALWLEHVTLPAAILPRVLPPLSGTLESLALLHVSGTRPGDMASLAALTSLTSLRLVPADHDVGGLEPLTHLRHLKKLSIR